MAFVQILSRWRESKASAWEKSSLVIRAVSSRQITIPFPSSQTLQSGSSMYLSRMRMQRTPAGTMTTLRKEHQPRKRSRSKSSTSCSTIVSVVSSICTIQQACFQEKIRQEQQTSLPMKAKRPSSSVRCCVTLIGLR